MVRSPALAIRLIRFEQTIRVDGKELPIRKAVRVLLLNKLVD